MTTFPVSADAQVATIATGRIKYLSPSSVSLWLTDRNRFIQQYIMGIREPQTPAMLLGLAFDGLLKERLGGPPLDATIPSEIVDDAIYCVGEYDRLMGDHAVVTPEWIFEASITRECTFPSGSVWLSGKPDAYILDTACPIILDWKVNGFYSAQKMTSPKPGYMYIAPEGAVHKTFEPGYIRSGALHTMKYNIGGIHKDWALQMWMYGLMVPGTKFCRIEQLTFDTRGLSDYGEQGCIKPKLGVRRPTVRISVYQALLPVLDIDLRSIWNDIMAEYDKRGVE